MHFTTQVQLHASLINPVSKIANGFPKLFFAGDLHRKTELATDSVIAFKQIHLMTTL
ncbi:Uncharacterised protein [Vibrio cholerae]|nr:Uncharacterised protein [Vibrio cholerae]CSI09577.1 Uncharacterised protein [Vibrio cholerae]